MTANIRCLLLRMFPPVLILMTGVAPAGFAESPSVKTDPAGVARVAAEFGKLPLSFEPGAAGDAGFTARGRGYSIRLTRSGAELRLRPAKAQAATIEMEISGGNAEAKLGGERRLAGTANYFIGSDPVKWRRNVPTYGAVRYLKIYRGIDLVFYGSQGQLEYDFDVNAGADPGQIRLHFNGSDALRITEDGSLSIGAGDARIEFRKPVVYQEIDGRRRTVSGRFELLDAKTIGFRLGRYDHARRLVIDPTLAYGTYIGGSGFPGDLGYGIAVDKNGNAYVTGEAESPDFPFTEALTLGYTPDPGSSHVFVSKFNAAGTALLWSTYIGGTYGDHARAIAVDVNNCAYVTGATFSSDYPATVGAFMTTNPSPQVGAPFVSKLTPAGDGLVYSTFLGGSGSNQLNGDEANAIVVDANLNAYVAGEAFSTDFPVTKGAYQTANHAKSADIPGSNAFLTKLSWDGKGLVYSTYLGGSGVSLVGDEALAVAVDASGNAYVAGDTYSNDFPVTASAFQKANKGHAKGGYNAFAAKFNASGTGLVYSTLLGGTGIAGYGDRANGITVDHSGNAYVVGQTFSDDFPVTTNSLQTHNNGANSASTNAFITKVNAAGSGLIYSTYLGGTGLHENVGDYATGIGLDANGNAYIAGTTYSDDFPVTVNALQKTNRAWVHNEGNAFIAYLNAAGNGLLFSTYLGGTGSDIEKGMTIDGAGNVFLTGESFSDDFPLSQGAFQSANNGTLGGGTNAFVAKVNVGVGAATTPTTTALTSSANPQIAAAAVTFTATVKAQSGAALPTGNVKFSIDGALKATVALTAGKASYSTSTLAAGTHAVTATYAGSTAFSASSAALSEKIETRTATPKFSLAAGTYTSSQTVQLSDATAGAAIHYTTNGTAPTAASTLYTAAIHITKTTTVKAIAIAAGHVNSLAASAAYVIKPPAPAPTFLPVSGAYKMPITVKISDKVTAGLAIFYTTNGTAPGLTSTKYTSAGIKVTKQETIKAIAIATGYSKSAVATATFRPK